MNNTIGIIVNRLTIGFSFAFLYQIVVGVATSFLALPLTGNIQDLISGIEKINSAQGFWFITWWIASTIIITGIALLIVKYKKYLSPYKGEKDINIPPKFRAITPIVIGAIISFLFFLTDVVIGAFVETESATDVQAIYQAAINGNFAPLLVSILFSILAGFIILGVTGRIAKVEMLTHTLDMANLAKIVRKKSEELTTTSDTIGLHPGALIHIGEKKVEKMSFHIIEYDKDNFNERRFETPEECFNIDNSKVSWINISGIHDPKVIAKFGEHFQLHPLVQADIMNTELRPKFQISEKNLFLILKMPFFDEEGKLVTEQFSLIVGSNYVLSFKETGGDIFDPIRNRIRNAIGELRNRKSDYLAYALADAIVDHYFVLMEKVEQITEIVEEELTSKPTPKTLDTIHKLKRVMITLRKSIWPLREVIDTFEKSQTPLIEASTKTYLRDVYTHTIQVMDTIESLREMVGGMFDSYLSSVSNKMNETMKTLTLIASIFIPITFIAGVYGTNFEYLPELSWKGSYFSMLGSMAVIAIILLVWFKKREWI